MFKIPVINLIRKNNSTSWYFINIFFTFYIKLMLS